MKRRIWIGLFSVVCMFALLLLAYSENALAYGMRINKGAKCTTRRHVTLDLPGFTRPIHSVAYRASERPDFSGARWQTLPGSSVGFYLSQGYGVKRVYMQIGEGTTPLSDSIEYRQSCEDPRFMGSITLSIPKLYEPFRFDVHYKFHVSKITNDQNFQILIFARVHARHVLVTSQPIDYSSGYPVGTDRMRFQGTLTVPIPKAASGFYPSLRNIEIFAKIRRKPGASNVKDIDWNNNTSIRKIELIRKTKNPWHNVPYCTGPEGSKNNILQTVGNAWVVDGSSTLYLNDCGRATTANEKKCDNNPVPGLGLRGVRWTRRPSSARPSGDGNYALHWYCEGFSNKKEGAQYYFRFRVKYDVVEIRIVQ